MILYYPVYDREKKETVSRELDIIVTKNTVITSHFQNILPLQRLFTSCKVNPKLRKFYLEKGAGHLLFHILDIFWRYCLIKLERIEKSVDRIEREIFQEKEKEMVREISYVKTDIISFWRIIEPQREILQSLLKEGGSFFGKELIPYFSDLFGTFRKVWNTLRTQKETILALEDTNQSLLSNKINEIIRILSVFSVIMLPLTLLSSIWGMNLLGLPFSSHRLGFWIVLFFMTLIMSSMVFYFRKKRWL